MRGKAEANTYHPHYHGITPAYAGKRLSPVCQKLGTEDHPRLCGEKRTLSVDGTRLWGSPPPMRGKVFQSFTQSPNFGITPAYAGKSKFIELEEKKVEDHPRLCGEKLQRMDAGK